MTGSTGTERRELRRARCRLTARRLPRFAAVWLPSALVWAYVLHFEGRIGVLAMLAVAAMHGLILLAAIGLSRSDPAAPRVVGIAMGACILLGATTTGLFAAVGGDGDFCAFILLTLYVLAALSFIWGWKAELTLLVLTVIPWLLAVPVMHFDVPTAQLAAAIAIGSVVSLVVAEAAARGFAVAFRHRAAEEASRRALEASRNAYRDLAEQAHEPIFAADPDGRFSYVNAALARCLGEPERALVGRPVGAFLSRHPANERLRPLLGGAAGEEPLPLLEFEVRTAEGLRWFETHPSVVRDAAGGVSGIRAICRDVTERKQLERERDAFIAREQAARADAEAAAQVRDEFLAMLSHELRSPLSSILTWTRMLRRGMIDQAKVPHALASMEEAAKAQERLVGDLLDISRIAAGKFTLQMERVDLRPILAGRLEAAREAAGAKGITLEEHLDPTPLTVRGDPTRLQQVVDNLLSNAIKFTPMSGRVTVALARTKGAAEVTVRDTGIGIAAQVLPHVFEEFHQADRSITRQYGGLGLGLAIARRLVEMHGGRIEAESGGQGRGATFRVRLPLAEAAPESLPIRPTRARPSRLEGVRVLVVEDDPQTLDVFTTLLARSGAEVRPAASVREAVDRVACAKPDVVVTDIAMPGEDGYALVRELRALERERGGHLPVIAVTALATAEDRERALVEGFDEHLTKPVDPTDLIDAVARSAAVAAR